MGPFRTDQELKEAIQFGHFTETSAESAARPALPWSNEPIFAHLRRLSDVANRTRAAIAKRGRARRSWSRAVITFLTCVTSITEKYPVPMYFVRAQ